MPPTYDPEHNLNRYYDRLSEMVYDAANQPNEDIKVVRWNTYYYKKYQAQNNILLFIIGVCGFIIVLKLLTKTFPYFDRSSYLTILGITIGLALVKILFDIRTIYYKDNMNFDEIDIGYNELDSDYGSILKKNTIKPPKVCNTNNV